MARILYGTGGDGLILADASDGTGRAVFAPGLTGGIVSTDMAGSNRVTDLRGADGTTVITTVSSDANSRVIFYGPDGVTRPLYVNFGAGTFGVSAVESLAGIGEVPGLIDDVGALTAQVADAVPASVVTAAGDLLVGTAAGTVGAVAAPVTSGLVLTSDTAVPSKVKWAAPAGGGLASEAVRDLLADVLIGDTGTGLVPVQVNPDDAGDVVRLAVQLGLTSDKAAAGDDDRFKDHDRFVIAGPGAGLRTRRKADLDLTTLSGAGAVAAALTANLANRRVLLLADYLNLDGEVKLPDGASLDLIAKDTVWTSPAALVTNGNTRRAALSARGTVTQILSSSQMSGTTLAQGTRTITHTLGAALTDAVQPGDYVELRSIEAHNANRTNQYFKGERNICLARTSTTLTLAHGVRDDYTIASLTIYRMAPITARVKGLRMAAHASAAGRQELLAVLYALQPQLVDCAASGAAAMHGLALWGCIGGHILRPQTDSVQDATNTVGFEGYGVYVAGSEGVRVDGLQGELSRHEVDLGSGGSSMWGMTRHSVIANGVGRKSLAASFSNHGADNTLFDGCTSIGSGGGPITRGGDTTFRSCRVFHVHADTETFYGGATQSTTHGFYAGEPDLTGSDRQGLGGYRLTLIDCVVEAFGNGTPTAHGLYVMDPAVDLHVENFRVKSSGYAVIVDGDSCTGRISVSHDGSAQFSGQGGVKVQAATTTGTAPQFASDLTIDYVGKNVRGPAVTIGGGADGGVSDRVRLERVVVTSLGSGQTAASPMVSLPAGTWGSVSIGVLQMPATNRAAAISNAGGARLVYSSGRLSRFADAALDLGGARLRGPRPATSQWHGTPHAGAGTNLTLVTADRTALRLYRVPVVDAIFDAVGTATAGSAPVLGSATYARLRCGAFLDNGSGSSPAVGAGSFLQQLGDVDLTGAVGQKSAALASSLQDGALDPTGSGFWWLGVGFDSDADLTTWPTVIVLATLLPMAGTLDLASPTVRGFAASRTSGAALGDLTTVSRDGTARVIAGVRSAGLN